MIEVDDFFFFFYCVVFDTSTDFYNCAASLETRIAKTLLVRGTEANLRIQAVVFMQLGIKAVHHQIQWILVSKKLILYLNVKL